MCMCVCMYICMCIHCIRYLRFILYSLFSIVIIVIIAPQIWDLRKNEVLYAMRGHVDTVTGVELSPDGSYLLSNAMDNTGETPQPRARLNPGHDSTLVTWTPLQGSN